MQNTISRNVSNASPIFAPAIGGGLVLLVAGAVALFYYVPRPSTAMFAKSMNMK
jgi:hypothetical protein